MPSHDTLDRLIDQLRTAETSERNQARLAQKPGPVRWTSVEDPIGWIRLFGYDPHRYFGDPLFSLEQQLRQKLWLFHNINDDVPITATVPAWLSHYPEYTLFGMSVDVREHGGPDIQTDHALTRSPDLALLPHVDFRTSGWMPRMLRWYEELLALAAGRLDITFFAWNRGCLDLAVQLRGYETFLVDTLERPEFVHDLLGLLTRERCAWHSAAAQYLGTGIGPTFVADDWVSVPYISPAMFHDFVLPRYLELEAFHGTFERFHSCGDQAPLHPDMLKLKTLGQFEISPWMDPARALANLPEDKFLIVKTHPSDVVVDSPDEMRRKLQAKAGVIRDSGRAYSVASLGLTPLQSEPEFIERVNLWLDLAREAFC